jgi:hypothetical protein
VAQQRDGPVADQAGGGVVSGDDQLEDRGEHLLLAEGVVAVGGGDEVGDHVLAGFGALAAEERGEVVDDRSGRLHRFRRWLRPRRRGEQDAEPPAEVGAVGFRDAEQLADHGERQRERVAGDQVDGPVRAPVGFQVGEQGVDDRPDAGLQRVDAPPVERGHRQPPQPGVVGRVDAEHVPGQRGTGEAFGDDLAAARQRGVHVLGQARVVQRGLGLLVPHDQPRRVPVSEPGLVHRAGRANLREQRERVVPVEVTPRVERRMASVRRRHQ